MTPAEIDALQKEENVKMDALLDTKFYAHDLDEPMTVRSYLSKLLITLLEEGECFSGKRPFGNSGWENFLLVPAIESGALDGSVDRYDPDYPEPKGYDGKEFRKLRQALVYAALRQKS